MIGCGRMGIAHSRRLSEDPRSQIVAMADASRETAVGLARQFAADAIVYESVEELFERAELDAVVICTPNAFHFDQATQALHRGWHVLCEKPLCDDRGRLLKLIEDGESSGPLLMVGYQRRFWSIFRTLRNEIASGKHGRIKNITSSNAERWQQTIDGTWRDDPNINIGGFIGDAGSHKIDIIFYITGLRPREVFARTDNCGSNVEIRCFASGVLEGDIPLQLSLVGDAQNFIEDLHIHCEDSDLLLRDGRLWMARNNELQPIEFNQEECGPESTANPVSGFLDVLTNDAANLAPATCALPVFDFTASILESGRTGKPVLMD